MIASFHFGAGWLGTKDVMRLDPLDRACLIACLAEWSCLRYLIGCAATDAERGTSAGLTDSTLNGAAVAITLSIASRSMAFVFGIINPEPRRLFFNIDCSDVMHLRHRCLSVAGGALSGLCAVSNSPCNLFRMTHIPYFGSHSEIFREDLQNIP
ncbi:hypothetical protein [Burkholderia sp. lig30]|uniref:hypothetical protein n=1 Tax=Burkholderia sp. lig30 TaxID=1192124 RepID=UPI00128F6E28|nr:hypothetical protein [Burkholderia sp. lig30]